MNEKLRLRKGKIYHNHRKQSFVVNPAATKAKVLEPDDKTSQALTGGWFVWAKVAIVKSELQKSRRRFTRIFADLFRADLHVFAVKFSLCYLAPASSKRSL